MMRVCGSRSAGRPVGEDDDANENFIEDDHTHAAGYGLSGNVARSHRRSVEDVKPREVRILRMRFGLQNGRSYTWKKWPEVWPDRGASARSKARRSAGCAIRAAAAICAIIYIKLSNFAFSV
jgi:hypothetical protein